jgi:hypothetical protein
MVLGYPVVACPFFLPSRRVDPGEWLHAPRLTLIDEYRGTCQAGERFEPSASAQREICNCGYARGRCDRFPEGAADAIRFSMLEDGRIIYIFERDHHPEHHGIAAEMDGILGAQMRAFAESHRLRQNVPDSAELTKEME